MGTVHHYLNSTRRERLAIDALGGGSRFGAIGTTLAARAFELLMVERGDEAPAAGPPELVGRWAGESVAIVADEGRADWETVLRQLSDLRGDAIVLLHAIDGFERLGAAAEARDDLFMQMCHLVVSRQATALEPPLRERFGPRFLARYEQLCRRIAWFEPVNLVVLEHS